MNIRIKLYSIFRHIKCFKRDVFRYIEESGIRKYVSLLALLKLPLVRDREKRITRLINVCNQFRFTKIKSIVIDKILPFAYSNIPKLKKKIANDREVTLRNALLIKRYVSKNEKGYLLLKFEKDLTVLIPKLEVIQERYFIIFLPASIAFFSIPLLELSIKSKDKFFIMPVFESDKYSCSRYLSEKCVPLPFNAASWVKKEFYMGYVGPRDIDCIMVAIFANVKRHWLLFKAMKNLPNELKAVCVGIPYEGRSVETLQKEAEEYGVGDRLTFIVRPAQNELRILLQRAKVFCALTHEEGSFIAVSESLMSGTPVIAFKNAYFGTKELINSNNGRLVRSVKGLRHAISDLSKIDNNQIRINSRKNFSSSVNCRKLNGLLKQNAKLERNQWSKDIEPFYCVRQKLYYEQTDSYHSTKNDYQWLRQNGINIDQVVLEENEP